MKITLSVCAIIVLCCVQGRADTYTCKARVYNMYPVPSGHEVNVEMEAIVSLNGVPITPQSGFWYEWWRRDPLVPGSPYMLRNQGAGLAGYRIGTHCYYDSTQIGGGLWDYYCIVTINEVPVLSDSIRIPWWRVDVDQKRTSDVSSGMVKYWKDGQFVSNHVVPDTFYIARYTPKVLQADTILTPDRLEKYRYWTKGILQLWSNHLVFSPDTMYSSYLSQLRETYPATLQTKLLDTDSILGNFGFNDPWLRDTADQFGPFNRGEASVFSTRNSPFRPNTSVSGAGSEYQGVFLNISPAQSPTYYAMQVDSVKTLLGVPSFLYEWSTQRANLIDLGMQVLGQVRRAVVFTDTGAIVTARYKAHLGSSSTSATGPTSQRKVIRGHNGYYHMAYESANEIWYTRSTDGGYNWDPEKRISSGDPAWFNRSPSIAAIGVPNPPTAPLVLVVWEVYAPNGSSHYVESRLVDGQTGSLFDEITISDEGLSGNYSMMPVAGYSNNSCW